MINVCIARIRAKTVYNGPLNDILDSYYELLKIWAARNDDKYNISYYNISLDGSKPNTDIKSIEQADKIIIPTEMEWVYFVKGLIHAGQQRRNNEKIWNLLQPAFKNKDIILLKSDNADTPNLFRYNTFPDVALGTIHTIDENDFSHNIHGMKFHFITDFIERSKINWKRMKYDFMYWGTNKSKKPVIGKPEEKESSGDERGKILRGIQRNEHIKSAFYGNFGHYIPAGHKDGNFMSMQRLVSDLSRTRTTICFNWMNPGKATARYFEAVACKVLPMMYGDYGRECNLPHFDFQRVERDCEINDFILNHRDMKESFGEELHDRVKKTIPTKHSYARQFSRKLSSAINA